MNIRPVIAIALVCSVLPAQAADNQIQALAKATGLKERQVRMLVGARTSFAEYRTEYDRVEARMIRAIGHDNYQRLISGQPLALPPSHVERAAVAQAGPAE